MWATGVVRKQGRGHATTTAWEEGDMEVICYDSDDSPTPPPPPPRLVRGYSEPAWPAFRRASSHQAMVNHPTFSRSTSSHHPIGNALPPGPPLLKSTTSAPCRREGERRFFTQGSKVTKGNSSSVSLVQVLSRMAFMSRSGLISVRRLRRLRRLRRF